MKIRAIIINVLMGGVFLLPSFSLAQNVKEDILHIKAVYEEIESFDSEVHHALYATYKDSIPIETLAGRMKKLGEYSYSNLGDMETFNHKDYSLMVSHDDKLILIQPPIENPVENGFAIPLDSLEKFCEKIETREIDNRTRSHCYYFQDFTYRKIEMVFDAETYW